MRAAACNAPARTRDRATIKAPSPGEVRPRRVFLFDQRDLPGAAPFLDDLLTLDRLIGLVEGLDIDEPVDVGPGRMSLDRMRLVLGDPALKVVGDADIERTVLARREDVDGVDAGGRLGSDPEKWSLIRRTVPVSTQHHCSPQRARDDT